jgi:hypothetical protein
MPWWAYSFGEAWRLGNTLQQIAGEMNAAALPAAALEHAPYRLGEAHMGVTDHQLDPSEAALNCFAEACGYERTNEGLPEALAFAVADGQPQ